MNTTTIDENEMYDSILTDLLNDPAAIKAADEWNSGSFESSTYDEAQSALADLSGVDPSDLLGTEVLVRLYRVAKVFADARLARLQEVAELAVHRELERQDEYADRKLMELD